MARGLSPALWRGARDFGPNGFKCVSTVRPAQEFRRDTPMLMFL